MHSIVGEERVAAELLVVFLPQPTPKALPHPVLHATEYLRAVAVVEVVRPAPDDAIDPLHRFGATVPSCPGRGHTSDGIAQPLLSLMARNHVGVAVASAVTAPHADIEPQETESFLVRI